MCFKKQKNKEEKRLMKAQTDALKSQVEMQEAAARSEQERIAELKKQQYERTKSRQRGRGMRSLVSGSASGYGRNFF